MPWINSTAAFRRLCVETTNKQDSESSSPAAAFRRLCVETKVRPKRTACNKDQPPLGGCVLKPERGDGAWVHVAAAFRRLCVETTREELEERISKSSRLRAAVC